MFKKLTILLIFFFSSSIHAIDLISGVLSDGGVTPRTEEQRVATTEMSKVLKLQGVDPYSAISSISPGSLNVWFRLYDDFTIKSVDINSKSYLGSWPLTRWPYLNTPEEIVSSLSNFSISDFNTSVSYSSNRSGVGCLSRTPLRYGDIETDGNAELVLFLDGELIVFSPQYQRTVFSAFWEIDDWEKEFLKYNNKPTQHGTEIIQYASAEIAGRWKVTDKAIRSYSKIYEGSFDGDNHADILVWQKVYESNTSTEAPGFKLLSNTFKHFERDLTAQATLPVGVTGEYLPQETTPEQIKTWLTTNTLTWQKGYPTLSECPGQETQLIPEMHDPLLNDPDVLQ